jgi:cholestenol delta-isomerase
MTAGNFTLLPGQVHPYFPVEAQITGYLANKWNTVELLTMFVAGVSAIFGITYVLVKRIRPTLSTGDLTTILWFVICGCIHSFFEGYFAYNFRTMGSMNDLFGQLWKEYSLSDSRYLTQDAFVLCMETVTAVCFRSPYLAMPLFG